MRSHLFVSVAVLAALSGAPALADVEIASDAARADGSTSHHSLSLSSSKAKVDTERATIIIDAGTGEIVTLMKARKAYMSFNAKELSARMSGAMAMMKQKLQALPEAQRQKIEAMMAKRGMPGAAAAGQAAKTTYESTGKSETVGAWSCKVYHQKNDGVLFADLCIAPADAVGLTSDDRNAFETLASTMAKSMPEGVRDTPMTNFSDLEKQIGFAGMPVKTVIYVDGSPQITTTVKSIDHAALSADAFAIPAGYTRMNMPGFGGAAAH